MRMELLDKSFNMFLNRYLAVSRVFGTPSGMLVAVMGSGFGLGPRPESPGASASVVTGFVVIVDVGACRPFGPEL